ncbi:MAG: ribosome silencing factor [bacterium]|nr:ribosome silencing factor [bacterium]
MARQRVPEGRELLAQCCALLQDKHVIDLRAYDVRGLSAITDYYLVGSVRNDRQMKAAGQNLTRQLKKLGVRALHKDGEFASSWIVLDYVDCIVHLFTVEARAHYDIESLWPECEIPVETLVPATRKT